MAAPPRHRARVGEPWGSRHWELAPIRDSVGHVIGCGATCKDHIDVEGPRAGLVCKSSVTIGQSGLSFEELRLRMKRWLLAGVDDEAWADRDRMRTHHVGMGGRYMHEFAVGLTEEECDRIAAALPP